MPNDTSASVDAIDNPFGAGARRRRRVRIRDEVRAEVERAAEISMRTLDFGRGERFRALLDVQIKANEILNGQLFAGPEAQPTLDGPSPLDPGILTHAGRYITAHSGVPSLADIALSLSRQPRFGGHARQAWSVLDHSLFVEELATYAAASFGSTARRAFRLAALFHDAHEALTGDVPTPYKGAELRALQEQMDERIANAYVPGGADVAAGFKAEIKELDRRALLAEALLVGPPRLVTGGDVEEYFGERPHEGDVIVLRRRMNDSGHWDEVGCRQRFLDIYMELR